MLAISLEFLTLHARKCILLFCTLIILILCCEAGEIIYAVNCGGSSHVDSFGIRYQKDPHNIGVASDHGKVLSIRRVPSMDQILYQTERYHTESFAYNIPISVDGDYVLVLKFSEVWFTEPNKKVFNIRLNQQHTVITNLDIFGAVGIGAAHDEIIPFSIKNNVLTTIKERSKFDGVLAVEFVKLYLDNPKINAIYIMRGKEEEVPRLPALKKFSSPLGSDEEELEEEEEETAEKSTSAHKHRRSVSELRVADPYASEDPSSYFLPVVIALAAFLPIVFCVCKL